MVGYDDVCRKRRMSMKWIGVVRVIWKQNFSCTIWMTGYVRRSLLHFLLAIGQQKEENTKNSISSFLLYSVMQVTEEGEQYIDTPFYNINSPPCSNCCLHKRSRF